MRTVRKVRVRRAARSGWASAALAGAAAGLLLFGGAGAAVAQEPPPLPAPDDVLAASAQFPDDASLVLSAAFPPGWQVTSSGSAASLLTGYPEGTPPGPGQPG